MNVEIKKINYIGILFWIILFFSIVPFKIIKKNKIVLIGFFYTIFILSMNIYFTGNKTNLDTKVSNLDHDILSIASLLNNKAVEISSAVFAIAIATKDILNKDIYRNVLLFITYTLIFGVGIIIPIYFINNQLPEKLNFYNKNLMTIRNVSLSYSVGFMICSILIILNRLFHLQK